jgi:hypothetical protein
MSRRGALILACIGLVAARADAQLSPQPVGVTAAARRPSPAEDKADTVGSGPKRIRLGPISIPRRDSSWWVPLASVAVPGSGQALLGQDRFVAYLALEAFAVVEYFDQRSAQQRATSQYQALASNVARSLYSTDRPVGNWAYYELMEHWIESGVFNLVPGGTFTPEADVTTYNGAAWLLARQTYWADPNVLPDTTSAAYRKAVAFYVARAIQPQYRFSWRNAQLEQDVYIQKIEERNQAARDARLQLGILIANHLLSMVDAYVTLRVHGGLGAPGSPTSLSATIPWAPFGRPSAP